VSLNGRFHGVTNGGVSGVEFRPFCRRSRDFSWRCPGTTRVRHEDGLKPIEERDADQVANKEIRIENGSASAKQNNSR
jgi:hypothetical protein